MSKVKEQSTPCVSTPLKVKAAQNVGSATSAIYTPQFIGSTPAVENMHNGSTAQKLGSKESRVKHNTHPGNKSSSYQSPESDCFFNKETKVAKKLELLPPPSTNKEWVQKAVAMISKYSGLLVFERNDSLKEIPCSEIAPHIRDVIIGDGACFFRAISKAITGTENNHFAIRKSLVNFMLDPANVIFFGNFFIRDFKCAEDAKKALMSYVNRSKMLQKTSWATEKEIHVAATMFQVKVNVFSDYLNHRDWYAYAPLFNNESCMTPMNVMLYLYHINGNHFDLVIPVIQ